jgi:putative PIN family toxin of toxin-antitoxin system
MRRAVLDANVLVSALLFPGICRSIVESLKDDKFAIALSPALLEDFLRALEKPKLKRLILPEILEETISLIHMKAVIVEPKARIRACRDPDDDAVLERAVAARAKMIVTGDKDLLVMSPFKNISIVSPRAFANRFKIL